MLKALRAESHCEDYISTRQVAHFLTCSAYTFPRFLTKSLRPLSVSVLSVPDLGMATNQCRISAAVKGGSGLHSRRLAVICGVALHMKQVRDRPEHRASDETPVEAKLSPALEDTE